MNETDGFQKAIDLYITEIKIDSVVSYSHITLGNLYGLYGAERVEKELATRFAKEREALDAVARQKIDTSYTQETSDDC